MFEVDLGRLLIKISRGGNNFFFLARGLTAGMDDGCGAVNSLSIVRNWPDAKVHSRPMVRDVERPYPE